MKSVKIDLPDDLALDAQNAGLLSSDNLERLLRDAIRNMRKQDLRTAMSKMESVKAGPLLSPEDVAAEIAAFRSEHRAHSAQ